MAKYLKPMEQVYQDIDDIADELDEWNGCEYCHEPFKIIGKHDNQCIWVADDRLYFQEVVTSTTDSFVIRTNFHITHCPMCGRELEDK